MSIFQNLLVAYDGSAYSKKALEKAAEFVEADQRIQVHVIHVMNPPHKNLYSLYGLNMSQQIIEEIEEINKKTLEEAEQLVKGNKRNFQFIRLQGDASEEIIDYATEHGVDLIIIGSRGLGAVKGMLLGSVSYRVVQYAECHVLIIK